MTDSMKFGPEWLRNMSSDINGVGGGGSGAGGNGGGTATIPVKYHLAEFRYSREEMLSLFDKTIELLDTLPNFKKLFVEKIQPPLALTPSPDDEVVSVLI